jgi:1-deoxy-D-xylulose-5-phosphate reductoisomerase
VLNAANEECVAAFLAGDLPFLDIVETVSRVVHEHLEASPVVDGNELGLDDVISADAWARSRARQICGK